MQKVIDYMTQHQIRPTELFRSFDKNVMFNMEDEVFISRLKVPITKTTRSEYTVSMGTCSNSPLSGADRQARYSSNYTLYIAL